MDSILESITELLFFFGTIKVVGGVCVYVMY